MQLILEVTANPTSSTIEVTSFVIFSEVWFIQDRLSSWCSAATFDDTRSNMPPVEAYQPMHHGVSGFHSSN